MIKIIALLVFILSIPSISISQIPEATGKPIVDISIAYGAIVGIKCVVDICGENFPDYKNNNQRSYNEWRSRNENFIKQIEKYFDEIILDTEMTRQWLISATDELKADMRQYYKMISLEDFNKICLTYADYMDNEVRHFDVVFKIHLQNFENYWKNQ